MLNMMKDHAPSLLEGARPFLDSEGIVIEGSDGFEKGEETLIAALDLEDAYNRVQYATIMRTLVNLDISPELVKWIGAAVLKRKVAMRLGGWASDPKTITPGLPQGSALSPVLFNIRPHGRARACPKFFRRCAGVQTG